MPKLNAQQQTVYDYIAQNPGSTTKDIRDATWVQCVTGRMSEMRTLGIVFKEVGVERYGRNQPFKKYALELPAHDFTL